MGVSERIYLSQPHMTGKESEYIDQAFQTNQLTLFGQHIEEFENRMSEYLDGRHVVAVNSGTSALHLALRYAGVGPGDYVLCSSFTFVASCSPVTFLGGRLIFVDSDESWNMSPAALEKALEWADGHSITIKAAVVVDIYGQPAKYDDILPLLKERGITVIEDAAESLGAYYQTKKCGTIGDYSALSFTSNKLITTGGGGGMVVSADEEAIRKMRFWAAHAKEVRPYHEHHDYGYEYRLPNLLAGIGCTQVDRIEAYSERRRMIFRKYAQELEGYPVDMMPEVQGSRPNHWLSTMTLEAGYNSMQFMDYMNTHNIETRMAWKPMHLQELYKKELYFTDGDKDVSADLFRRGICLPSASVMSDEQLDYVIDKIKIFFERI